MSNKDDLSAELIPCDRADSHGQHGSATMLMAWRSAPPRSCWKCELKDQLEVERSTFSKIRDGSDMPHAQSPCACHFRRRFVMAFPVRRPADP